MKRTALDGTEYSLLLLDSEGIDAYDQTVKFYFSSSSHTNQMHADIGTHPCISICTWPHLLSTVDDCVLIYVKMVLLHSI